MSDREEKEKFENYFSKFEGEKRNFKPISPLSRGEREISKRFLQLREENEKFERMFANFEKRKRN